MTAPLHGVRSPGFSRDYITESFGLSPDARHLTLSTLEQLGSLMVAEGVLARSVAIRPGFG